MFEKVNPAHPDKIADRIAGALVDLAYKFERNPRIAVEVLIGHGTCHIIAETSVQLSIDDVTAAVHRIAGFLNVDYSEVPQDVHLSRNQSGAIRCGDNGIFKGVPVTAEQKELVGIATDIYNVYPFDGKYMIDNGRVIICQSNAEAEELRKKYATAEINPLGDWTGGTDVDTGATNRKLGSDMADSVTGGGLHGKDLSKADVSVNIYAWLKAQEIGKPVEFCCAIGDETVGGIPYEADYNPRKDLKPGDAEYEKLKRSIEQFGYVEPVIWNQTTGRVVGGHQRLKVLMDMGMTEVDCVVVAMDEDKEKALNIALNKISGDWDKDKLALLIADLQGADFDVSLTGFEPAEIDALFKDTLKDGVKDDDFDVGAELAQPTMTKPGDI